jgi:hypothetical protein
MNVNIYTYVGVTDRTREGSEMKGKIDFPVFKKQFASSLMQF